MSTTGAATEERAEQKQETRAEAEEDLNELIVAVQCKDTERASQLLLQGALVHSTGNKTAKIQLQQISAPLREVDNVVRF